MKKELFAACSGVVFAGLMLAQPVLAVESYTAKLNEEGKFCATVKVAQPGGFFIRRMKCRSLEEWEAKGYEVSYPEGLSPEEVAASMSDSILLDLDKSLLAQIKASLQVGRS